MKATQNPAGTTFTHTYRYDGLRHQRLVGANSDVIVWDGQDQIAWVPGGSQTTQVYARGADFSRSIGVRTGGAAFHRQLHLDALGNVQALTTASQTQAETPNKQNAFGSIAQSGTANEHTYHWMGGLGYWWDGNIPLYYIRNRWMPSQWWRSADPVEGEPRYSYAHQRPTVDVDPSGTQLPTSVGGRVIRGPSGQDIPSTSEAEKFDLSELKLLEGRLLRIRHLSFSTATYEVDAAWEVVRGLQRWLPKLLRLPLGADRGFSAGEIILRSGEIVDFNQYVDKLKEWSTGSMYIPGDDFFNRICGPDDLIFSITHGTSLHDKSGHPIRFLYTCRAGWIDGEHLGGQRMAQAMYRLLKTHPFFRRPNVRFAVSSQAFVWHKIVRPRARRYYELTIPPSGQRRLEDVSAVSSGNLTDDVAWHLAQFISYDLGYKSEQVQSGYSLGFAHTVFSYEDLISDWLGTLSSTVSLEYILKDMCGAVDRTTAKMIYLEVPPGNEKNDTPFAFNPIKKATLFHLRSPRTRDIRKSFVPRRDPSMWPPDMYDFYNLRQYIRRIPRPFLDSNIAEFRLD